MNWDNGIIYAVATTLGVRNMPFTARRISTALLFFGRNGFCRFHSILSTKRSSDNGFYIF